MGRFVLFYALILPLLLLLCACGPASPKDRARRFLALMEENQDLLRSADADGAAASALPRIVRNLEEASTLPAPRPSAALAAQFDRALAELRPLPPTASSREAFRRHCSACHQKFRDHE